LNKSSAPKQVFGSLLRIMKKCFAELKGKAQWFDCCVIKYSVTI